MAKKVGKAVKSHGPNGNRARKRRWTVMIFMGVGPLEGAADMTQAAEEDLDEIARATQHERVNVFVQKHAAGPPTRHWFMKTGNGGMEVPPAESDPVDGRALTAFVEWALDAADHQPGDHSLLVIWGHAHQFTVGHVKTGTGVDALDFRELALVLANTQKKLSKRYTDGKIDIVGFDACDLATVEMAFQLSPYVNYMIASQMGIPIPGWPYDTILEGLVRAESANVPMRPDNLGAYIVRKFCRHYLDRPASLTLLDLQRAREVFEATEALAGALAIASDQDPDEQGLVNLLFQQSQTVVSKPFVDVADLCMNLTRYSRSDQVTEAAGVLGDILMRPERVGDGSDNGDRLPFVLEHGRNNHQTTKLQGISLYAPQVAAESYDWRLAKQWYLRLGAEESLWSAYVHILAESV